MPSTNNYVQVADHYILVPQPKRKEDIFFINEKKENAFWQRDKLVKEFRNIWWQFIPSFTKMWQTATLYDKDGLLASLNEEDSNYIDRIYQQEVYRRVNGVHFKNGDNIEWLTGDHYFFLMYARMQRHDGKGQFADYRKFQRNYAYIIHHARTSEHILGAFVSKPKKTGITNFHWSGVYLNKATLYKNKNLGYMNINLGQAAKTFNDYFMYAYNGLASPLKPLYKNKSERDGYVTFAKSYRSTKTPTAPNGEDESELNTSVFCVPTKAKAFDVAVMSDITFDEPTKYEEDFAEIWRTNKEAVKIQSKFNGRAWAFNYTPEEDSVSFMSAKKVFDDSELRTITPDSKGQTRSGMINYHIPAYGAWEGAFDKYGECDEDKARKEIQVERDKAGKDKRALQAIIRQYANDKREAWGTGGISSVFDPIRLGELIYDLDEKLHIGKIFEQGKLVWKNRPLWEAGKQDKRPKGDFGEGCYFDKLDKGAIQNGEKGRLIFYDFMPTAYENMALRQGRDESGNLLPPARFKNVGAIDPTDFRNTSNAADGSFDSMYCMSVHDEIVNILNRRPVTKTILAEYLDRPDNPEEFYQDAVKFIIYTGGLFIVEANNGWLAERLESEGLGHYMLFKDEKGILSFYDPNHNGKLKHVKTLKSGNVDTVADLILLIKNYLLRAEESLGEIDYGKLIYSMRLLMQLKDFDPNDTKRFDTVMSFGYTLMAHEAYLVLSSIPETELYQASKIQCVANALFNKF